MLNVDRKIYISQKNDLLEDEILPFDEISLSFYMKLLE